MDYLMNNILQKEEEYKLWDFKIGTLHLWPLIRSSIISKYLLEKRGFEKARNSGNKFNILLPKLWIHHLKTFNLLNFSNESFDVLFLDTISAGRRYSSKKQGFYEHRVYGKYFESFSKPLNFERSYRGFFPKFLPKYENTFIGDTLNIMIRFNEEINKKVINNIDKDNILIFLKAVESAFNNIVLSENIGINIIKLINNYPIVKQFYFNKISLRIKNKIAFIHCASYLGNDAILTKIFHFAGFKVVEVQHGSVSKAHYAYNYPKSCLENKNHQCREYLPDYLLMFGDYWAERVRTPSKKIIVGYPYLNELSEKLIQKISPEEKTILIVSQGTVTKKMVNIAKKLSRAFTDYKIIFKLHPGEIPFKERYSSLKSYSNIKIIRNFNIYELIAKSNILIGYNSTTLFEALKFPGKRIFIVKNNEVPDEIGYKFSNISDLVEGIKNKRKGYQIANSEYFLASDWQKKFTNFAKHNLGIRI